MMSRTRTRARMMLATLTAAALLLPAGGASAAQTTTTDPIRAAAGWLANQLVDGERLQTSFGGETYDDAGLTADAVLGLSGIGVAADEIARATTWLETQTDVYTGLGAGDAYAGAIAKLALVAAATGSDPRDFGGVDLIAHLEERETGEGRFADRSEWGDFSNVITQSLAIIALERATDGPSVPSVDYLTGQACDDGGFPTELDPETCESSVDATGFAVQALVAVGEGAVARAAGDWLLAVQADDGSFGGQEAVAETNSTGLAAAALALLGDDEAAAEARAWLIAVQEDCVEAEPGALPFAPQDRGDVQRSTAQGLFGLAEIDLAAVTAEGASPDVPTFDCPYRFSDVAYGRSVHARAVHELATREIVTGRDGDRFAPTSTLTRGQVAAIIGRADPEIEPSSGSRFSDVDASPHAGYINALADRGIVEGYPDGTYRPGASVTRAQVATILAAWLELPPSDDDRFTDTADSVHRRSINALAEIGVASGTADGRYLPANPIQRDQAASLVFGALTWAEQQSS